MPKLLDLFANHHMTESMGAIRQFWIDPADDPEGALTNHTDGVS